jgi:hypothetical protein
MLQEDQDPACEPMARRGELVYLDDAGQYSDHPPRSR